MYQIKKSKLLIPKEKLKSLYYNKKLSTTKIAEIYRCNPETIRRKLVEYSFSRRFHEIKFRLSKRELFSLYIKSKKSIKEISEYYNCSPWTVRSNLLKYGLKLRKATDFLKWRNPGNQIVPNLSHSKEISYILGVLLGDGWTYNYKNNYLIGLDVLDYQFCKSFYGSLKKVKVHPNIFRKGRFWRSIACSKQFYSWFNELEYSEIENIAQKYPLAFLRGIYESEGCLSINHDKRADKNYLLITIVSCEKETINLVKLLLERERFNPRLNLRKPQNKRPIWALNLCRQEEIKDFLKKVKPVIKNQTQVL